MTPLTESGLLTALTVIMALMAVYLPVLGMVGALLWAVPIILLVVRHGLRWGIMAVVVSAVIMAVLIEPMLSLRMTISFAPTGLALGYGFRQGWPAVRIFAVTLVVSILAKMAGMALVFALTSVNPMDLQQEGMQESFDATFELYETLGMNQTELDTAKGQVTEAMSLISMLVPLILVLMGLMDTVVNYIIATRVMKRLGISVKQMPPFSEWRLPQAFIYLMGFALVGMYWGGTREIELLYQISLNANMLALMAGLLQGLSLLVCLGNHFHVSRLVKGIVILFVFTNGFLLQIVAFTGLFDMAFDYRRRFGRANRNQ